MKPKIIKKRAFTLIEILIASTIFAAMMMLFVGVITRMSTYQSRLKAARETAAETRRLNDLLTQDIRWAKGGTKISVTSPIVENFSSGLILFYCENSASGCSPRNSITPPVSDFNTILSANPSSLSNTLVLFSQDSYRIYTSQGDPGSDAKIYYVAKNNINPSTDISNLKSLIYGDGTPTYPGIIDSTHTITNTRYSTSFVLGGFAPDDDHHYQQPYVEFSLVSKTLNYDSLMAANRTKTTIESAVTLRSYK